MDTTTAILQNVNERTVNRKRDNREITIRELVTSEGTYVVRKDVYDKAAELVGAQIDMITRVEQNGEYTNYFADYVEISKTQPTPAEQAINQAQKMQASTPIERDRETRISIHRQKASAVAADLHAASPATNEIYWQNVEALFNYYETGETPLGGANKAPLDGYEHQDDDIPF